MAAVYDLSKDGLFKTDGRRFRLNMADAASPAANRPVIGSIAPPPPLPPLLEDGLTEGADDGAQFRSVGVVCAGTKAGLEAVVGTA